MAILSFRSFGSIFGGDADGDAMAKSKPINERLVATYVDSLVRARTDRAAFERVFASLKADEDLRAPDVIAIAQKYMGGGRKASSKSAAHAAISKRFVEIVRFHAKNKVAERVRPW